MNYLKLTWDDIEKACFEIAQNVQKSGIKYDTIISIGRGGMIPSRLLSDYLNISQVYMFNIKLYKGVNLKNNSVTKEFFNPNLQKKSVLLVDDIIDSGETVDETYEDFSKKDCSNLKVITIVCKNHVIRKPSYFGIICDKKDWVIFPWEKSEFKVLN